MKKVTISRDTKIEILFLISVFILYTMWAILIPFGECPDEPFRYKIPDYIYQFGKLPKGDTPYVMDDAWGISYAFTPILSYMVSAVFMKITSIFTTDLQAIQLAARMASVFFSVGTAYFTIRIGKKLFRGIYSWMFIILVTLLPQFIFISAYVNCDALCIFSVAWIIYAILEGNEKKWSFRSTIFLGVGIGICLLSYYNAYGGILMAAVFCVLSVLTDKEIEKKGIFLAKRIGWVVLAVLIVAGWWFIRSYIIYDGDILGLTASRKCGELHAVEELKPHNRQTPSKMGYSLGYMLKEMGWIHYSVDGFIGRFGWFLVALPAASYIIVKVLFVAGIAGNVFTKKIREIYEVKQKVLFHIALVGSIIITVGISVYYSYFNDFQPQGRYCLPMWIPLAVFITAGLSGIIRLFPEKARKPLVMAVCLMYFAIAMNATYQVIAVTYY